MSNEDVLEEVKAVRRELERKRGGKGDEVMNEPTMETLARRLDRVERENRRLKLASAVALVLIAALMLMGQARVSGVAKVVEAERFVLRDTSGRTRAELAVTADDSPGLRLLDAKGRSAPC